jgi:hypothetical protein
MINSDTGRALADAKVAVAAHKVFSYFGDKSGEDFDDLELFNNTPALEVFGLTAVSHRPAVGAANLAKIEALAKNQPKINSLPVSKPFRRTLSNLKRRTCPKSRKSFGVTPFPHDSF